MRKVALQAAAMFALTSALALPGIAAASAWKIDPVHSAAQFSVRHLGISTVRGEFSHVNGTVMYDGQDITKSSVEVSIDMNTLDTREPARDKDVSGPNFLDVAHYPTMTFKSTKVEQVSPGKLRVTGDFTLHGVTKSITLNVEGPSAPIKDPWGNQRMAASATTTINRQDYGVKYSQTLDSGGLVVGNDVAITLDVEMTQPPGK